MHRRRGQLPASLWRSGAPQSWRKELRRFVARAVADGQATLLGKAAVKEPLTPNAALTTKRSMRFGISTRESPGVSFLRASQKGVVCYVRMTTIRVWQLCWRVWRVDRRLKDNGLSSLSLL